MNKEIDKIMKYFTKLADTYTVEDVERSHKTDYNEGVKKSRTIPAGETSDLKREIINEAVKAHYGNSPKSLKYFDLENLDPTGWDVQTDSLFTKDYRGNEHLKTVRHKVDPNYWTHGTFSTQRSSDGLLRNVQGDEDAFFSEPDIRRDYVDGPMFPTDSKGTDADWPFDKKNLLAKKKEK